MMSDQRRLRKDAINFLEVKEELNLPLRVLKVSPQSDDREEEQRKGIKH